MAMAASSISSPPASFYTYQLGPSALYVPLTSRCNSRTLPELRGNNFLLPSAVVAALCRVRDASDAERKQWAGWCAYLDTQETLQKLPPPLEPIGSLTKGNEEQKPTIDELFQEIQSHLKHSKRSDDSKLKSIVFSGEGEPTLRFHEMLILAKRIKEEEEKSSDMAIRLTTNGLATAAAVSCDNSASLSTTTTQLLQQCLDHGISHMSVGFHTGDAGQFNELVRPVLPSPSSTASAHERVCEWVHQAALLEGMEVEVTAVARPDVDVVQTEELSQSLGVETPVRWRPYFP
ncbi:MAG: hypothetical protein SGILL_008953 [Bacillariaceae sp.]